MDPPDIFETSFTLGDLARHPVYVEAEGPSSQELIIISVLIIFGEEKKRKNEKTKKKQLRRLQPFEKQSRRNNHT